MRFFIESLSCVDEGGCKFICDAVDRAHIPCFFPKKMRLAGILPHSLGSLSLCFLRYSPRLAFRSDCEFTCDAANCSLIPNTFPRKTRLAGGIPQGSHCHSKFSFIPKPVLQNACHFKRLGRQRRHTTECLLEAWMG